MRLFVIININGDTLRVKEIDLQDEEYDLYGMSVGIPRTDFEDKIVQKGFSKDTELDSMRYVSYKNGNVYIGISYDENDNVSRLFVNLLLDYTEWRGVE